MDVCITDYLFAFWGAGGEPKPEAQGDLRCVFSILSPSIRMSLCAFLSSRSLSPSCHIYKDGQQREG